MCQYLPNLDHKINRFHKTKKPSKPAFFTRPIIDVIMNTIAKQESKQTSQEILQLTDEGELLENKADQFDVHRKAINGYIDSMIS